MNKLVLTLAISVMATTAYAGGGKLPSCTAVLSWAMQI